MTTVADIRASLDRWYPPELAETWDRPGLVCGDPADPVGTVACALEATDAVVDAAIAAGAQMLVVHHPLLLRGVSSVAADTPKGRIVHRLIRSGIALMSAHTNADAAVGGVNDVLAEILGIRVTAPLERAAVGDNPLEGIGRVGELDEPLTLREFTARAAERLPVTVWGVRAAGDPDQTVRTVALCSGAGDALLADAASSGADVYLTSDLRHHPADEQLRAGGPALIDTAHWASESPWCRSVADRLAEAHDVTTTVLEVRTDPWTIGIRREEV
ncbi:Nif3-like dinuclear metal center hexameric protein [Acidipropionibacterium virtanenii]|uniref:GTP cyclohydrolase 1 type 2 homolog n=1 Tax=Acidipropionibacterium virtanenii TaxID=2057246 RepID=A0A344UVH6_9ACTN|nr:Nif3-like dinuclear metal center hexameric protein [Acidipropionibacterium virtanenii]AXE39274.1 GTP cyclohydrolase 1 type 2 [Acidipropionibacterium virtanenii]